MTRTQQAQHYHHMATDLAVLNAAIRWHKARQALIEQLAANTKVVTPEEQRARAAAEAKLHRAELALGDAVTLLDHEVTA